MVEKYTKEELSVRLRNVLKELEIVTGEMAMTCDEILITYLEADEEENTK